MIAQRTPDASVSSAAAAHTCIWNTGVPEKGAKIASFPCTYCRRCSTAAAVPDGKEPWLIMFKKGVDGGKLWDRLCPEVTIGDNPMLSTSQDDFAVSFAMPSIDSTAATSALNCTARFSSLLNGLAGV